MALGSKDPEDPKVGFERTLEWWSLLVIFGGSRCLVCENVVVTLTFV